MVLFVLLAAFAAGLALLLRDRSFSYTEHLVFALHLHAFWFLAITFIMLGVEWASWMALLLLVMPAYAARAFRRVYGGPRCSLALRCAVLTLARGSLVLAIVALTGGPCSARYVARKAMSGRRVWANSCSAAPTSPPKARSGARSSCCWRPVS